jgi:hypothetical protein
MTFYQRHLPKSRQISKTLPHTQVSTNENGALPFNKNKKDTKLCNAGKNVEHLNLSLQKSSDKSPFQDTKENTHPSLTAQPTSHGGIIYLKPKEGLIVVSYS